MYKFSATHHDPKVFFWTSHHRAHTVVSETEIQIGIVLCCCVVVPTLSLIKWSKQWDYFQLGYWLLDNRAYLNSEASCFWTRTAVLKSAENCLKYNGLDVAIISSTFWTFADSGHPVFISNPLVSRRPTYTIVKTKIARTWLRQVLQ